MQSQIVCHGCRNVLLYPRGAPSVCCVVCHAVTSTAPPPGDDTSVPTAQSQNVTVVVENPMTVDAKGKLVSNVVVGVTTGGKK
ncbi:hypothetical protein E2562_023680 [Oryza meyeriana var. granulata]|uniref:Zinc finger LSD1-type domain-containing protein n=1 Tax=Oryza meyeriana var. granulata TaxID=110450 RepID=A0A6G1BNQ2_9ORYZ|nr:hypothetical protein E2562_023680 [Oryza meyeriana var. granulata]